MSEAEEVALGRTEHANVLATEVTYDDSALAAYVGDVGRRLAAVSERPDLPWTFTILDDDVVNAMAMPGGFVYITRGILTYLTSEAELAGVLGHEIGHVTARHTVVELRRKQDLALTSAILMPFGTTSTIDQALHLSLLKYNRDDEAQSDRLSIRYMERTNYDPRPLADVFVMFGQLDAAGGGGLREYQSSHPDPARRAAAVTSATANGDFLEARRGATEYLRHVDGMVYGKNPRNGFVRDNVLLHPNLGLQFTFPEGWSVQMSKGAVAARSPRFEALIAVGRVPVDSPDAAVRAFLDREGVNGGPARHVSIDDTDALAVDFRATLPEGEFEGTLVLIEHQGGVYHALGVAQVGDWPQFEEPFTAALESVRRITDTAVLNTLPLRIEVVTIDRAMTLAEFDERHASAIAIDELAIMNQVDVGEILSAGTRVKRVARR